MLTIKLQIGYYVNEKSKTRRLKDMLTTPEATHFPKETQSFEEKITSLKKYFQEIETPTQKYEFLIDLGKRLPQLDPKYKTEEFLVRGCQSLLFIRAEHKEGLIFFSAASDALISSGLASLLISVYNGEKLETILTQAPHFLEELGIYASLSPNRAQGISQMYLKMKYLSILLTQKL